MEAAAVHLSEPMRELLACKLVSDWSQAECTTVQQLKYQMCSEEILTYYWIVEGGGYAQMSSEISWSVLDHCDFVINYLT